MAVTKFVSLANMTSILTQVKAAITAAVNQAKADLIDGAPETLDTLKEVADAIAANKTVADGLNAAIGNKADKTHTHAFADLTGKPTTAAGYGIGDVYTKTSVYTKTEIDNKGFLTSTGIEAMTAAEVNTALKSAGFPEVA